MSRLIAPVPAIPAAQRSGRFATALLWLFFVLTLVAPAAPLNKVVFVLLAGWVLLDMVLALRGEMRLVPAPFFVLGIFAYGYALSWLNRVDTSLALQFFVAGFVLMLIHFVLQHRVDVDRLVESSALVLLAFTAMFWVGTLLPDLPGAAQFKQLVEEFSLGAVAERDFLDSAPTLSIHLGTVPFLFVAFCLCAARFFKTYRKRDAALLMALGAGIVLSASRGLIAISAMFLIVVLIGRVPIVVRVVALLLLAVVLYAALQVILANSLLLSVADESNAVKIGHFLSYFDDLTIASALFGRGLGSYYYSSGSMAHMAHTEITPLDMARYVGVVLTAALYVVIVLPTTRLRRYAGQNRLWVIAFLLYVTLSTTNPVMFNSYGMLVVLWYWTKVLGAPAVASPVEGAA